MNLDLRKMEGLKSHHIPLNKGFSYGAREAEITEGYWGGTDMAVYSEDGLIETRRTYANYGSALPEVASGDFYADMYGWIYAGRAGGISVGSGSSWSSITTISSSANGSFAPLTKDLLVYCSNVAAPYTITKSTKTAALTTGAALTDCYLGVCCTHQNRVWIAGGYLPPGPYGKIWYSDAGNPNAGYAGTSYINCGDVGVELIVQMLSMGQYMYVIKQNSLWVKTGSRMQGSDFTVLIRERFYPGTPAVVAGKTQDNIPATIYAIGSGGLYAIQDVSYKKIPLPFNLQFQGLQRRGKTWHLSYWEKMGWLFLSFPDVSDLFDTYLYIYDTIRGLWYFCDNPGLYKGISTSNGEFITAHYQSKQLRDWGSLSVIAAGQQEETLTSNLKTGWNKLGSPLTQKFLHSIEIDTSADKCQVHLRRRTDTSLGSAIYTSTIDHNGKAVYAPDYWFRDLSLKIYTSDNTPFSIRGPIKVNFWEVEI